jgi:hypothetical protein
MKTKVTSICAISLFLFVTAAFAADSPKLPSKDRELYDCMKKTKRADLVCEIITPKIDLQCYRECVTFCQDVTDSIYDEQECIRSQCLEGGSWGC